MKAASGMHELRTAGDDRVDDHLLTGAADRLDDPACTRSRLIGTNDVAPLSTTKWLSSVRMRSTIPSISAMSISSLSCLRIFTGRTPRAVMSWKDPFT